MNEALACRINRIQLAALAAGLLALAASAWGAFSTPKQFLFSYLVAFLFWLGLSLGCFAVTMMHQLTGGRWGYPTRRFFEAGFMALPVMLLLFLPIFFGLRHLYPWARPSEVAVEQVLQHRSGYENAWGFIGRQVLFLLVWSVMAWLLRKWSLAQDKGLHAGPTRKARALSGPGLVVYGLLGTFAAVDWIVSLEVRWYSTMFGVIVLIGQILSAYAFAVLMLAAFGRFEPLAPVIDQTHYRQLGNLLLTFVLFWTYVSFSQFLIIYSGDLPRELEWYRHRITGSWRDLVAIIALCHFFLPFLLLLFRRVKARRLSLTAVAAILFVAHLLNLYWLVMPALHPKGLHVSWLDLAAPVGVGGIWLGFVLGRLKAAPLLPQNDPGMQFAFAYEST